MYHSKPNGIMKENMLNEKCSSMIKRFTPLLLTALLFSCSADDYTSEYKDNVKVRLSISNYEYADGDTRTVLTPTSAGITFAWDNNEKIGVFPVAPISGSQVGQVVSGPSVKNGDYAEFDGGPWLLREGSTYTAYYPYQGTMALDDGYDQIPVTTAGQTQVGDDNTSHIGESYDYMFATPSEYDPKDNSVTFEFHHVMSIIQVKLTMPNAASLTNLTFANVNGDKTFCTAAKMNATNGALTKTESAKTSSISLGLSNVEATAANQELTFYIAVMPTTTGQVKVTAIDTNGESYSATLNSKTTYAGRAYRWKATLQHLEDEFSDKPYVDMGTGDGVYWAKENVSSSYYAWAITTPNEGYNYTWANYGYTEDEGETMMYYNGEDGGQLDPEYYEYEDAAYVANDKSRIPTYDEFSNLIDKCDWVWDSTNNGYNVYNRSNPSRHIFIPVSGKKDGTSTVSANEGFYWTANVVPEGNYSIAYCLHFTSSTYELSNAPRYQGLMIRPVFPAN